MKRIICLILAFVMCLGFAACKNEPVQDESEISVDTPADVVMETGDTEAKEEEPPVDPATIWDGSLVHGGEGFYDPERDYSKEERFKVCAFTQGVYNFADQLDAALEAWFTLANVQYDGIIESKGLDIATEVEQIAKEYDGVVLLYVYNSEAVDIARILKENNCSFISYGDMRDYSLDELPLLCPTIHYTSDFSAIVGGVADYIGENLKDVPDDKIGIIYGTESGYYPNLEQQFLDEVELQIPEYSDNCYLIDFYSAMIDYAHHEAFFEKVLDEHSEVEHWIYVPIYNSYYNKYRDAETVFARRGLEGKAVIFSMNSAYDIWVTDESTFFEEVYSHDYVFQMEPLAFGLAALMRGDATPETLWAEYIPEGEKYAIYPDERYQVVTRENYKDYFEKVNTHLSTEFFVLNEKETAAEPVDAPPEAPDYRYEFWAAADYPEYAHFCYDDIVDKVVYTAVTSDLSRTPTRV